MERSFWPPLVGWSDPMAFLRDMLVEAFRLQKRVFEIVLSSSYEPLPVKSSFDQVIEDGVDLMLVWVLLESIVNAFIAVVNPASVTKAVAAQMFMVFLPLLFPIAIKKGWILHRTAGVVRTTTSCPCLRMLTRMICGRS